MSRVATADPLWTIQSTHTPCLCQVGRGKGGCLSGSERTTHSWHDGLPHAPVWTKMDAYRVIRQPGDEVEGAPWACGARRQRGPVEIASGPAPAVLRPGRTWLSTSFGGEIFLLLPWLARLVCLPDRRVAADHWLWKMDFLQLPCSKTIMVQAWRATINNIESWIALKKILCCLFDGIEKVCGIFRAASKEPND